MPTLGCSNKLAGTEWVATERLHEVKYVLWGCRRQISHALHGIIHDVDEMVLAAPHGQQSCPCTAVVPQ